MSMREQWWVQVCRCDRPRRVVCASDFDLRSFDDFLFDCALGDESVHENFLLLTDAVGSIHGLKIHLHTETSTQRDDNEQKKIVSKVEMHE